MIGFLPTKLNEQNVYTKDGLASLIEKIKREARRISKTTDRAHCQALEDLAQVNGFKSYAALNTAWKNLA